MARLAARITYRRRVSPVARTDPRKLALLLSAALGRRRAVELGTGTAWTTISLVLAEPGLQVLSYDPIERPERERYLQHVSAGTRERLRLVGASGEEGPRDAELVELLYVDSSHARDDTMREVEAWRPVLGPGSLMIFDDFGHPEYPGVEEAVRRLGLVGEQRHGLFFHRVGG